MSSSEETTLNDATSPVIRKDFLLSPPVWGSLLFNIQGIRLEIKERPAYKNLIKEFYLEKEEKHDTPKFTSSIGFKVLKWVAKGKLKAKRQRYELLRKNLQEIIQSKKIVTVVNTLEDIQKIEKHKQGNFNLYTDENLSKREELRKTPMVKRSIDKLWKSVLKSNGLLLKETYIEIVLIIYDLLMVPNNSLEEAKAMAEDEWRADAGGDVKTMNHSKFFDAFFELADIWTEFIDPNEYSLFLNCMNKRVSDECQKKNNGLMKPYEYESEEERILMSYLIKPSESETEPTPQVKTPRRRNSTGTDKSTPSSLSRVKKHDSGTINKALKNDKPKINAIIKKMELVNDKLDNKNQIPNKLFSKSPLKQHSIDDKKKAKQLSLNGVKSKYLEDSVNKKPRSDMTLEKVILHQMRHTHTLKKYPVSYVHLCGFLELGVVGAEDIYGEQKKKEEK
ncbi:hypothetical protein ABK040_010455 [Willaertia magna]